MDNVLLGSFHWSKSTLALASFAGYLILVRLLRWRRYNAMMKRYSGRPLESITPEEAQQIIHVSRMYDMPWIDHVRTRCALRFKILKTNIARTRTHSRLRYSRHTALCVFALAAVG